MRLYTSGLINLGWDWNSRIASLYKDMNLHAPRCVLSLKKKTQELYTELDANFQK